MHTGERGDGRRKHDTALVIALLDGGSDDAGDADAVAAHFHDLALAVFVQVGALQGLGVFPAQLEDVADFNAAAEIQAALAVRRRVAGDDADADVGDFRFGGVAAEVGAGQVEPAALAPQTKSLIAATVRSATTRTRAGSMPTGPM